ncbi:T9SS type B sorting domain-containing protein [Seonamhaeicola algicola]|uniref:T9SS type B sorting domain-containing protein n=1 Tax=Seonamhaeicola algicola TaxID=1719036 RepID=A0A5C7AGH9_9FLAO|nr:T9SS type B sorting domain-containing protein [Seonamhaeicola algicola]TXE07084.1 T9SS type B sorting domain-containing protein [Seonamhaeicola algicola]
MQQSYVFFRNLLLLLVLCFASHTYAQLSKTHYIPPLTSAAFGNANPEGQFIYISTPTNSLVPYTIIPVGQPTTNYITGTVSNANPQTVNIGSGSTQLFVPSNTTSTVFNNKGYIIEAEAPIYVSVRMLAGGGAQAGALVSKGLSAPDTTFRIGTYTSANPQDNYLSFVSVMATEDNTSVTFDDLPAGLIIKNYTGTLPVNINLNEGESYVLAINIFENGLTGNNLMDGLIGCLVNADKPIVVNCGSTNGSFDAGGGRDYGIDQIAGLSKIGNEYIFVKGNGLNAYENVLVVAHTNNTSISINGNAPIATINAGEYYVIEGNNFTTNDNLYVETSNDTFMYQGVGASSEANQGMFFVPPLSCETRGNINNIANINEIGGTNFSGGVSIVTKTGATVTVNNLALSNFSTVGPSAVTGKPDYVTYKVTGLTGNVSVQGDDELYVAYFNVNGAATSGSFYSGFPTNPEINFDAQFATLGNCIPNITLEAANTQSFDSYEWWFDDGSGFQIVSSNVPSITPTIPGKYKLIGEITCTGDVLESVEVPVSICPDDIDNDGIIDNIDIDNDNDGIENCVESRGNVTLNIQNTNNPILVFQDNTTSSSIATGNYTSTSSSGNTNVIIGDNTGNFTSTVGNAANAESNYTINFTEPVNVKLTESSITNTPTDGEIFIVSIAPANKNITVVDPDNRLLIDSNFDGLFETGITQLSGSEIHFRINPAANGNTPFHFFANSVNGFSFKHQLQNINTASTFSANISLTCFKNDNDNDGIKDELDLDSDNDGIPDIIERSGSIVTPSGNDVNNDGLDDVFDFFPAPIDTDNDGVMDFYDLDSDNDGISDLVETGQLGTLSDTNFDGVEDGPTYGINGWADAAETSPDSNTIGYTLNDFDADTIFSYIDADSDGDGCSDVIEAGFSDANNDDYLGDVTVTVNANGLVTNATDGYTLPNADYLTFAPITIDNHLSAAVICENSNFTIPLVSADAETIQWEFSTDNGTTWAALTNNATFSGVNTFNLNITNAPLSINNSIFRAFLNRAGNSCGIYTTDITITVNEMPVANTAANMQLCDDDNNGTMPFNLTLQNSSINSNANFTITYHETQADADTNTNAITSPFESGNTTIYARVENNSNVNCYATSSFNLEVFESPFPSLSVTPLQACDDTSVGTDADGLKTFDLTQKETEILNGQSATNFSIRYFIDAAHIIEITNPNSFDSMTPNSQTIYVRVTNNANAACYADTTFNIEVYTLPNANTPNPYTQCDDASNDGQAFFNLTLDSIKNDINPNYSTENLSFSYYLNQTDAQNATNPIISPESYQDAPGFTPETVWIRVENPNGCYRTVPLTLNVSPSSAALSAYNPNSIYQCDDGVDDRDGISTFDFSHIRDYISNTIFSTFNVTVHFYESLQDAELETNEIADISNHQNTISPNMQTIWVRVKSNLGNNCLGLQELTNLLIVEALPIANPVVFNRACDIDTTDTVVNYSFDTSNLEVNILNGQDPASVTISYFDTSGNPLQYNNGTMVTSPIQPFFLTETQTITVRVTNNTTQDPDGACFDETTIDFIVDEQPVIADPIAPVVVCDGDAGDFDFDGLYAFDTSGFASVILGTQTNMNIFFDYEDENGILITNSPTLPNPLISGTQNITARVVNPVNTLCSSTTTIQLIVNPLPDFIVESPLIVCTSDPTFTVELDPIEANITETFTYEWRWTSIDGTTTNQLLPQTTPTIEVSTPGTYHVILTKTNGTGCSRTRNIFVNASELATITTNDVTIIDFTENNNSVTINTTNLGQGNYEFALVETGTSILVYQDEPVFNNVKPGFYTIYINDKNGCGYRTLNISVLGYMKFFTPNNDGFNDEWKIIGVNDTFQNNSTILIFDRYGKLLKQISTLEEGWDGTSRGNILPTDDYWFKVFLEDGRVFSGHFTLKR